MNNLSLPSLSQKREQYLLQASQQKRNAILSKPRKKTSVSERCSTEAQEVYELGKTHDTKSSSSFLINALYSYDYKTKHYGVHGIGSMVCGDEFQASQALEIFGKDCISKLIKFAANPGEPLLQEKACWCIMNLLGNLSNNTAKAFVEEGGLELCSKLMSSLNSNIIEYLLNILGNLSASSQRISDLMKNLSFAESIMGIVQNTSTKEMLKFGVWCVSNLTRCGTPPEINFVKLVTPFFCSIVKKETNKDILYDALWALALLSRNESQINCILSSGILPKLIHHLGCSLPTLTMPSTEIIGNLLTGTSEEIKEVISTKDFYPKIIALMDDRRTPVRKNAYWILSNITGGDPDVVDTVIKNSQVCEKVVQTAFLDTFEIRFEAVYVFMSAIEKGEKKSILKFVHQMGFQCFQELLYCIDNDLLRVVLRGIQGILKLGKENTEETQAKNNVFVDLIIQQKMIPRIMELANCPDARVSSSALSILSTYFNVEKSDSH